MTFVNLYDDKGEEVIVGRLAKNVQVDLIVPTKELNADGTPKLVKTKMDIGGWNVSHPAPPKEEAKPNE